MTRIKASPDPVANRQAIVAGIGRAAASDRLLEFEEGFYLVAESQARVLGGRSPYSDMIALPSDFTMRALGSVTLKRIAGGKAHALFASENFDKQGGSSRNITIQGFTFDGNGSGMKYAEHRHLIDVIGTTNFRIMGNRFVEMSGDGVLVGRTYDGATICAQPRDFLYKGNYANGRRKNRNAVSIISCSNPMIEADNVFEECTRPGMPAAVDLEPDMAGEWIEGGYIRGTFRRCKSNVWMVAQFPGTRITGTTVDIVVDARRNEDVVQIKRKGGVISGIRTTVRLESSFLRGVLNNPAIASPVLALSSIIAWRKKRMDGKAR
ncbi:MAG: hypothetical protein H0W69_02070 [Gemmatimonadaceae bacterium]|nr:hypothetical protein [Gemmatimonadaceae bacterium]